MSKQIKNHTASFSESAIIDAVTALHKYNKKKVEENKQD